MMGRGWNPSGRSRDWCHICCLLAGHTGLRGAHLRSRGCFCSKLKCRDRMHLVNRTYLESPVCAMTSGGYDGLMSLEVHLERRSTESRRFVEGMRFGPRSSRSCRTRARRMNRRTVMWFVPIVGMGPRSLRCIPSRGRRTFSRRRRCHSARMRNVAAWWRRRMRVLVFVVFCVGLAVELKKSFEPFGTCGMSTGWMAF